MCCLVAIGLEKLVSYPPDTAWQAALGLVGGQAGNLVSPCGHLILMLSNIPDRNSLWDPITAPALHGIAMKIFEKTQSSELIKKLQSVFAHFKHLNDALLGRCGDANALKRFMQHHNQVAKTPKYSEFWDVTDFLAEFRPQQVVLMTEYQTWRRGDREPQPHLAKRVRASSVVLCRLSLLARNVDINRCKAFKMVPTKGNLMESAENDIPILWLLIRRKKDVHRWEPIVPCTDPMLCPVRFFTAYWKLMQANPDWGDRAKSDEHGETCSIWKGVYKPYKGLSRDTTSNDAQDILEKSGVDTTQWKADSIRGAAASAAVAQGIATTNIMMCGNWSSLAVFQRFRGLRRG